jgi:hypothetical protein
MVASPGPWEEWLEDRAEWGTRGFHLEMWTHPISNTEPLKLLSKRRSWLDLCLKKITLRQGPILDIIPGLCILGLMWVTSWRNSCGLPMSQARRVTGEFIQATRILERVQSALAAEITWYAESSWTAVCPSDYILLRKLSHHSGNTHLLGPASMTMDGSELRAR